MQIPETSRLFTRWCNPANGVESLILTHRLAPVQRPFYFTNPSFTDDGRFLWLECAYPPDGGRNAVPVLAVIDFHDDEMRVFHETQVNSAGPLVDQRSGEVYWGNGLEIWKRGPAASDRPRLVNRFPAELAKGRRLDLLATHLTLSADRTTMNMDARFGSDCFVGEFPLDGSAPRVWEHGSRLFNHAQFSPTDPATMMMALDPWLSPDAGPFDPELRYHRIWLHSRGGSATPLLQEPVTHSGHEWWDPAGRHIWYIHYGVGVKRVDLATRDEELVWPGHLAHGMSDRTGRYVVADSMSDPVRCDCRVDFRDLQTGREIRLVDHPPLADDATQCRHLHPHPMFCLNDRYVCHMTTAHGRVDLALVPTAGLISRTA
jgi:hypothetical protein